MLRLFKILIVAALLAGLYFYLQHTPFITTTWDRINIKDGISLAFPHTARHHTTTAHTALFGHTKLDVFDFIDTREAYICLRIQPQHDKAMHRNLEQLLADIRQLNDTAGMHTELKKQFVYRGYPAYEYHATDRDQRLWIRLLKINGEILSLIYAIKGESVDARQAENFFNSLRV